MQESFIFLKIIFTLAVLVCVIFIVLRLVFKRPLHLPQPTSQILKVRAVIPISHNKFIQLLDIIDRILVIGVWENGMVLLSEIKDKEIVDAIRLESSSGKVHDFSSYVERFFIKPKPLKFIKEQITRLKNLK